MGTSLWNLPSQPLPRSDVVDSTFVTIWAFVCLAFVALFTLKLKGNKATWPEFAHIKNSTILLSLYYIILAVDRWMHYERRAVTYGYILLEPICHGILYLGSTLWYFWGTYIVLWNDLERRFRQDEKPGHWWLAAKIVFFFVFLVSFFFAGLNIATRVVWLQFFTFNVISDVATKRNHFEIAMTIFFAVFGLFTVLAAVATFVFRHTRNTGTWARTKVYILVATVMLFLRSLAECVIAVLVHTTPTRRADTRTAYDLMTGLLTTIYLLFMYLQAIQVARNLDTGSDQAENVRSDVRRYILRKLETMTNHHQSEAPPWSAVLDQTETDASIATILEEGPLSSSSSLALEKEKKTKVAKAYIKQLRKQLKMEHKAPTLPPAPAARLQRREVPYDSTGTQSAPLASAMLDSLRGQSSRHDMRHAVSHGDMRAGNGAADMPRFGHGHTNSNTSFGDMPRFGHNHNNSSTSFGSGPRQAPRMTTVQEYPPPAAAGPGLNPNQLLPDNGRWGPPPPAANQGHGNWSRPPAPEPRASPTRQRFDTVPGWHDNGNPQPQHQQPAPTQTRRVFDLNAPPEEEPSRQQQYGAVAQHDQPGGWGQQYQQGYQHQTVHQDAPEELGDFVMTPPLRPTVLANGTGERRAFSDSQFPTRPLQTPDSLKPPHLRRTRPAVDEGHRAFTDPTLVQQQQQQQEQQQFEPEHPQQNDLQQHPPSQQRQYQSPYAESVTSGARSPVNFDYNLHAPTNTNVSALSDLTSSQPQGSDITTLRSRGSEMTMLQAQGNAEIPRKPLDGTGSDDGRSASGRNGHSY